MSDAVVLFDHVWKKFRSGERHDSLRDLVPALVKGAWRRPNDDISEQEFWAIKDVSFEVKQGEALGIIGPNGAGKSTALKLLTRILKPTRGHCLVKGRIGALIEVAAGFHPDLTGRENTYLQGAVMGMKRAEVSARFDEIVEFAGVSAFIDTQVKRYSSGMNARLGFSIAAHLNPNVLIIDEVLSVGDMAFQARCIDRMRTFKRDGVTIVFVSHNLQAVVELCDQALYLHKGARALGPAAGVIKTYVGESFAAPAESSGNELRIVSTELTTSEGKPVAGTVVPGTALTMNVEVEVRERIREATFALLVHRSTDQLTVYDGQFSQEELGFESLLPGRLKIQFQFHAHLTRGQYYLDVIAGQNGRYLARVAPAGHLTMAETRTWGGVADLGVHAVAKSAGAPAALAGLPSV